MPGALGLALWELGGLGERDVEVKGMTPVAEDFPTLIQGIECLLSARLRNMGYGERTGLTTELCFLDLLGLYFLICKMGDQSSLRHPQPYFENPM